MKIYVFTTIAAISLFTSSWVLAADPYNDAGLGMASAMGNGDSNGLVQGSGNIESQDAMNSSLEDNAGVTKDGETMGEED